MAGLRRRRALPFREARETATAAFRTNHLLRMVRRILRLVIGHWRKVAAVHERLDFSSVEHLAFQQRFGDLNERSRMLFDDLLGTAVVRRDDPLHFLVDLNRRLFAVVAMLGKLAPQEDLLFLLAEAQRAEFAHAPL